MAELRGGWCLGGEGFRERMLRLLEEGLRCLGLERKELPRLKKGDPRKAALAVRIRTRTTASNAWIAEQLQLGHVSRLNQGARTAPPELLRKLENAHAK